MRLPPPYVRVYTVSNDKEGSTADLEPDATRLIADLRNANYDPAIYVMNVGSTSRAMAYWRDLDRAGISNQEQRLPAVSVELGPNFFMRCGYAVETTHELFRFLEELKNVELDPPTPTYGVTVYTGHLCPPSSEILRVLRRAKVNHLERHADTRNAMLEMAALVQHRHVNLLPDANATTSSIDDYPVTTPLIWVVHGEYDEVILGYSRTIAVILETMLGKELVK